MLRHHPHSALLSSVDIVVRRDTKSLEELSRNLWTPRLLWARGGPHEPDQDVQVRLPLGQGLRGRDGDQVLLADRHPRRGDDHRVAGDGRDGRRGDGLCICNGKRDRVDNITAFELPYFSAKHPLVQKGLTVADNQ